ncbi:hypothetical protein AB4259_10605 [Vibrio amylolyticus]|uniref:hypothetical protein n=1 Tax=Vibrio amylolyticus TaxID=2847292 RepID=UPI00354F38C9
MRNAAWHIKHAKKAPALLMGSSRSSGFYGPVLASQLGTSLVKLDLPGSTLGEHRYNLDGILQEGARPKHVFIAIDDFDLYYKEGYSGRLLYPTTVMSKKDFYVSWLFNLPTLMDAEISLKHKGEYQRIGFGELFEPTEHPSRISINQGLNVPAMEANQFSPEDNDFFIDENLEFVKDIVALSKEYNFELTLFFTPRWVKAYYRRDHEKLFQFKKRLAGIYPFYDFSYVNDYMVDSQYWIDSSHFDTNLGVIAFEKILNEKKESTPFGRFISKENVDEHLEGLKVNLLESLNSVLKIYPDMVVSPILEGFINPSYIRINLPDDYIKIVSQYREYTFVEGVIEYSKFLTIKLGLTGYQPLTNSKKTIDHSFAWNAEYRRKVSFGVGNRYSNNKQITLLSEQIRPDGNKLNLNGDNGFSEVKEVYVTIDINEIIVSEEVDHIFSNDITSVYQLGGILILESEKCSGDPGVSIYTKDDNGIRESSEKGEIYLDCSNVKKINGKYYGAWIVPNNTYELIVLN